ncbi:MAG: PspC domain-containing protein [Ignavibacteriaceae bacterium]
MDKKLYRSTKDKMIGGVAAGLAEYFDIDATIVRVIFVVSLFLGGAGILAYIILWVVVPEKPRIFTVPSSETPGEVPLDADTTNPDPVAAYQESIDKRKQKRSVIGGLILIIFGMFFLADEFFPRISFEDVFSVALIIAGILLLLNATKRN